MTQFAKKIVLNSTKPYSEQNDQLLYDLIDARVEVFCAVGTDCEMWHDIMDELIVGDGTAERDFEMMTTWHVDETVEEVIDFARIFDVSSGNRQTVQVIEI